MDDLYMDYINRVARMTLAESYGSQLNYAQPSAKYRQSDNGSSTAEPFPGYSVMTPSRGDDPRNEKTYSALEQLQSQLSEALPGVLAPVPPSSFHLTIADLIWHDAYRVAAQSPDFHSKLRNAIAYSLQSYESRAAVPASPCMWQILGLVVMPRAIGVGLAPKTEAAYRQILDLRRSIYQNRNLMALGVEQQYHLTAHITLGYFTERVDAIDQTLVRNRITALNDEWQANSAAQSFQIYDVELRQFEDMATFAREPDWPQVTLAAD
ncbi:MAG: hypothetical protein WBA10_07040 [Elainellaceae cyanobacterium]